MGLGAGGVYRDRVGRLGLVTSPQSSGGWDRLLNWVVQVRKRETRNQKLEIRK